MIARAGSGWQTVLADLAMILFMLTASALSQEAGPVKPPRPTPPPPRLPPPEASRLSEPLAVYRAEPGAPPLGDWLAAQSPDPRQQLTIVAFYAPGGQSAALMQAAALARQGGAGAAAARIRVEPGVGAPVATLAYDVPGSVMARALLQGR